MSTNRPVFWYSVLLIQLLNGAPNCRRISNLQFWPSSMAVFKSVWNALLRNHFMESESREC